MEKNGLKKIYLKILPVFAIAAALLVSGKLSAAEIPSADSTEVEGCAVSEDVSESQPYTIEKCYDMVRENYPLVERCKLIELTEEYTLKNAYMNYFPQISFTGSASYQTDALAFPSDISKIPLEWLGIKLPTFSKDQYLLALELSQVIWDGGMIAADRANIRAKAEVDKAEHEINIYSLKNKINDLYFGVLYLNEQIRQLAIVQEDLDREHTRIANCIANGVASPADLDVLEVERITQKQNTINLQSLRESYLKMLSLFIGEKIDSDMLVFPFTEDTDMEMVLNELIVSDIFRPELNLYKAQKKEINTQLDYWTAGGLPNISLFIKGGYGRPGLNMLDDSFAPFAVGGIRLVWNISKLYSLGYGKKIVNYSKAQIDVAERTFRFNTEIEADGKIAEIRRFMSALEDDDRIVELREKLRKSVEAEVENGTKNASDLLDEMNRETLAKKQRTMHEIELMKSVYELKTIKNN